MKTQSVPFNIQTVHGTEIVEMVRRSNTIFYLLAVITRVYSLNSRVSVPVDLAE